MQASYYGYNLTESSKADFKDRYRPQVANPGSEVRVLGSFIRHICPQLPSTYRRHCDGGYNKGAEHSG